MNSQQVDWVAIAPPVCLVLGAVLALLGGVFVPSARRWLPTTVSLVAVAAALVLAVVPDVPRRTFCLPASGGSTSPGCSWEVDRATVVWWVVVLVGTGLVIAMLHASVAADALPPSELHLLVLASSAGALSVAAAGDLVTLIVAVETVSLPVFALVALGTDRCGAEAALKLFLVSVVATALSLLGIALVYGATGSVVAGPVADAGEDGSAVSPVIGVGLALTVSALAFKVAAVPFQAWVPDTYVGAPVPVAAYLSVVSKAAGLAGLVVVFVRFFPAYDDTWRPAVAVAAAVTMTVGNLAALGQRHLVRLLAWSSVAQAGYLLVPLAAGGAGRELAAMQTYALMYAVVNLAAFAAAFAASSWGATNVADLTGLARRRPLVGGGLAFALICLAGLPPGIVGLVAKVVVFQSAVDGRLAWLAVVIAVNVAIGLVYYLRVVAILFRSPEPTIGGGNPVPGSIRAVLAVTLGAAVVLSVLPGALLAIAYS